MFFLFFYEILWMKKGLWNVDSNRGLRLDREAVELSYDSASANLWF